MWRFFQRTHIQKRGKGFFLTYNRNNTMADHAADVNLLVDILLQFWEVCAHAALHTLHLYPPHLFEERMQYGLPVMQNRHPDVCRYINKVLENSQPLVAAGLVERLLLQVILPSGLPAFQISFAMQLESLHATVRSSNSSSSSGRGSAAHAAPAHANTLMKAVPTAAAAAAALELQEELRGSLLKMTMSLAQLPVLAQNVTWSLGLVTHNESTHASPQAQEYPSYTSASTGSGCGNNNSNGNSKAEAAMAHAMQSGHWIVDNEHLPHVFSAAAAAAAADQSVMGMMEWESRSKSKSGGSSHLVTGVGSDTDCDSSRVVAIKSFAAAGISSSIYVHVHV
jgi:hypothetical protein